MGKTTMRNSNLPQLNGNQAERLAIEELADSEALLLERLAEVTDERDTYARLLKMSLNQHHRTLNQLDAARRMIRSLQSTPESNAA
jgi:hypothetical protein